MIHQYYLNGYYIVLDVNSGAVHVVDKLCYELLEHITPPMGETCPQELLDAFGSTYSKEDIQKAYGELYSCLLYTSRCV